MDRLPGCYLDRVTSPGLVNCPFGHALRELSGSPGLVMALGCVMVLPISGCRFRPLLPIHSCDFRCH